MKTSQIILSIGLASRGIFAQNFASSCSGARLSGDNLIAKCSDGHGGQRCDQQSLQLCVGNIGGELVALNNGYFGNTCSGCSISGTVLQCSCQTGQGGSQTSSLDLNDFIGDSNGDLACFGHFSQSIANC